MPTFPVVPFAPWLETLRQGVIVDGLRWLGQAESQQLTQEVRTSFASSCPLGMVLTHEMMEQAAQGASDVIVVAAGPGRSSRQGYLLRELLWLVDPKHPQQIFLALNAKTPSSLWVPLATKASAMREACAQVLVQGQPDSLKLWRQARFFMGYVGHLEVPNPYSGQLEAAGPHEMSRFLTTSPFLEHLSWGSAYADDPWPDVLPQEPGLGVALAAQQRRALAQSEGFAWSETYRSIYSRSYFGLEVPFGGIYVAALSYMPAPHASIITTLNATFELDLPLDLPLDLAAQLLSHLPLSPSELLSRVESVEDEDELVGLLHAYGAATFQQTEALEVFRRYLDHPSLEVRQAIMRLAYSRNAYSLLCELALVEDDQEGAQLLEQILEEGIFFNPSDPYSFYDEGSDEQDAVAAQGDEDE